MISVLTVSFEGLMEVYEVKTIEERNISTDDEWVSGNLTNDVQYYTARG